MDKDIQEMYDEMLKEGNVSIKSSGIEYKEQHYEAYSKVMEMFDEAVAKAKSSKPEQYRVGIDTFERMRANATFEEAMGFIRWNIDKYNTRKKGQYISDYKKIKDYCDEAIHWLTREESR